MRNLRASKLMIRMAFALPWALVLITGCAPGDKSQRSDDYPNRPIKVVVPFSPGGETDTFARIIKKGIEDNDLLPVPLVILNRDGAGATIGSRSVKNARPDGYTILLLHNALFTAKYAGNASYGPEAFEPVAGTGQFGMMVAMNDSPKNRKLYPNLKTLLQKAKEKPKTITFGINLGTPSHFAALMLEGAYSGAKFRFTQSGSGMHRYSDVRGEHVALSAFSVGEFVRFDGLRGLAHFGEERHPGATDVPTANEHGLNLTTSNMQFWWFPKGTQKKRVDYFAKVLHKALQTEFVKKRMKKIYCDQVFVDGEQLQKRIDDYTKKLEKITLRRAIPLPDIPAITGIMCLILAGLVIVGFFRTRAKSPEVSANTEPNVSLSSWLIILTCGGLTAVYVLVWQFAEIDFRLTTPVFVIGIGTVLTRFRMIAVPVNLLIAFVLGFGLYFLFTRVFVIDLF